MKPQRLPRIAAVALALALSAGIGRAQPLAVAPAASSAAKPGPRLQSPTQLRDNDALPANAHEGDTVVPQINIPLGRTPPPPAKAALTVSRTGKPTTPSGIDDSVARCEAQSDKQARLECRDRLAHQGRGR